ncbi:MAG: Gldg family protein [Chitinivibrionales bacterium]|nr:Gldg family protein [Chitinivibrionales bacterium]
MTTLKTKNISQTAAFVAIVLGFLALANYVLTRTFLRLDLTEKKVYSISPATKKMLKGMDDIVNINVYFSKNLPAHVKVLEASLHDILAEYKAFGGKNLHITWTDPSTDETRKQAVAAGIPEIQMQAIEKDKAQIVNGFIGLAVLYGDKKETLPVLQDLGNFEYDLTLAIMKVSRKSVPKIGVLKTDTVASVPPQIRARMNMPPGTEEQYKPIFDNLRKTYDVELVDITNGTPIDTSFRTLIVPGGSSFTDRDLFEIDQYFMRGGNLIMLVDAVKVELTYGPQARVQPTLIANLAEHYGVRVERDLVLDASCGQVSIPQNFGGFQMNVQMNYPYFVKIMRDGFNRKNPAVSSLGELILPWPSSLTMLVPSSDSTPRKGQNDAVPVRATILIKSSPKSWTTTGAFNLAPQQKWAPPPEGFKQNNLVAYLRGNFKSYFTGKTIPPLGRKLPGDTSKVDTVSAADKMRPVLQENSKGNLVVAGNSSFMTANYAMGGNVALLLNLVDWLTLDESLIAVRSRELSNRQINQDMLKEGSIMPMVIRVLNIFLMPVLVVIIGLVIFMRRNAATTGGAVTEQKQQEKKA